MYLLTFSNDYSEFTLNDNSPYNIETNNSYFWNTNCVIDTSWAGIDIEKNPKIYSCERDEVDSQTDFSIKCNGFNEIILHVTLQPNTYVVSELTIHLGQIYPRVKRLFDNFNFNITHAEV